MKDEQVKQLNAPLPAWAVKPNPVNSRMSTIDAMAVVDRLNEVFGVGGWIFEVEYLGIEPTKMGTKEAFAGMCKGTLKIMSQQIHLEQFGGSTNMDRGDALKGSATDALTKMSSYLGIGASIYRGQGNVEPEITKEEAITLLRGAKNVDELKTVFVGLPVEIKSNTMVKELKDQLKVELTESK